MEWHGKNQAWRISGSLFNGVQTVFPKGLTDGIQANILMNQNPTLRIFLQPRDLSNDYDLIGVVQSTNGLSSFGIYIARNKEPHQPQVCVELMTPAAATEASERPNHWDFKHALLNQIVHRVAAVIFSDIEGHDFGAFGVYGTSTLTPRFLITSDYDWQTIKENALRNVGRIDGEPYWKGSIQCPRDASYTTDDHHSKDRGILWDELIYNVPAVSDADTHVYVEEEDTKSVIPEKWHTIKPMWKEHTPIVYYNRNQANQFWIEETRCKTCGQRIIVHLSKAQCPEGTPDTTIRCSACKNDFQFH